MSQKRSEFRRILVEFVIRAADYRKTAISVNAAEWVTEYKVRGRELIRTRAIIQRTQSNLIFKADTPDLVYRLRT